MVIPEEIDMFWIKEKVCIKTLWLPVFFSQKVCYFHNFLQNIPCTVNDY